jgi:hypothetical protein
MANKRLIPTIIKTADIIIIIIIIITTNIGTLLSMPLDPQRNLLSMHFIG